MPETIKTLPPRFETAIDRLVDYVGIKRRVSLSDAARAIRMPAHHLEKLALLLEESGILGVDYTLTGVELVSKELPKKEIEKRKTEIKKKSSFIEEVDKLYETVAESEKIMEFMEYDVVRRIENAERLLKNIEKRKAYAPEELEAVDRELEAVTRKLQKFDKGISELSREESLLASNIADFREKVADLKKRGATLRQAGMTGKIIRFIGSVKKIFGSASGIKAVAAALQSKLFRGKIVPAQPEGKAAKTTKPRRKQRLVQHNKTWKKKRNITKHGRKNEERKRK